jgi:hypothetical protein
MQRVYKEVYIVFPLFRPIHHHNEQSLKRCKEKYDEVEIVSECFIELLLILFNSCTVTKRVHRKGWHVEWRKSYKKDKNESNTSNVETLTIEANRVDLVSDPVTFEKENVATETIDAHEVWTVTEEVQMDDIAT